MTWDEAAAIMQLVVRGVVGYAPLLGILAHASLHAEGAAFQRLLLIGIGVRVAAEEGQFARVAFGWWCAGGKRGGNRR